ncbi:type II toxin-antitoxin system RelE/ParE family toxin [Roseateles sp.]|uniref:type II toxin-antitoxin system RelE/ParE family toxin n=1 Tax=Roseateles sp. TaxID=1971397 RepID=UPI003267EF8B
MSRFFDPRAEAELAAAFRFYRREAGVQVAQRFLEEFERIARLIEHQPGLGTPTGDGRRSYPLHDFPYSVIYATDQ